MKCKCGTPLHPWQIDRGTCDGCEIVRLKKELAAAQNGAKINALVNKSLVKKIERLIKALNLAGKDCDCVHHPNCMQHGGDEPCPVEEFIADTLRSIGSR